MKSTQPWDAEEGLEKLRKYCAWQERCRSEAWSKLLLIGCPRAEVQSLLDQLEKEGFLDEARYARSYARGKFNQKGWGRVKIWEALRGKHVPENCISEALELIEEDDYLDRVKIVAQKKLGDGEVSDWETAQKLRLFLKGKGYEHDVIDRVMKSLGE